jgi:hypothetical protein
MEKLLESAAIAWNPIREVRRRLAAGTLTTAAVVGPFIGIVIACNLFGMASQRFFYDTLLASVGTAMPVHPLTDSDYARQMLSALGVLLPVGAVSLLPASVHAMGRSTTGAAVLVTSASWAFYGAAVSAPVYFFAGVLASADPELGLRVFVFVGGPLLIATLGLIIFFWCRIMLTVLHYSGPQVLAISVVVLVVEAALVAFFASVLAASPQYQSS